jgi:flagellar FliL protein
VSGRRPEGQAPQAKDPGKPGEQTSLLDRTVDDSPEEREEAPPPSGATAALRGIAGLLPTVGILAGLAAVAFAVVLFVVRPLAPPVKPAAANSRPSAAKVGRVMALDAVVVNVAQTEGRRYLKAAFQLEAADEEKALKELEARRPQLLDMIIATLARKSLSEVTAPDALDRVRTEVFERLTQAIGREKVRRIFITEFVVQ